MRSFALALTLCLIIGCAHTSPKLASAAEGDSKTSLMGVTIKADALVALDPSGEVKASVPLGGKSEPFFAIHPKSGALWVADAQGLAVVDEAAGRLRTVATFPKPSDPESPPHIAGLNIDAKGASACVEMAIGSPYAMGEEEVYKAWHYSVSLGDGTLSKKTCSAHVKPATASPAAATLKVVREAKRCGLMLNKTFYAAPLARERSGGGCQLTVQPALPSGRWQPVYALVGADDAMQLTYVLYLVDLKKGALVDLSALSSDWEGYTDEEDEGAKAAKKSWAKGLAVYLDLESKLSDAETLPWFVSPHADRLYIADKEAVVDLTKEVPSLLSVGQPFVFVR